MVLLSDDTIFLKHFNAIYLFFFHFSGYINLHTLLVIPVYLLTAPFSLGNHFAHNDILGRFLKSFSEKLSIEPKLDLIRVDSSNVN